MSAPATATARWTSICGVWLAPAVVFMPQALIFNLSRPDPPPWWRAALGNLLIFMLWALSTPAVLRLRRYPPTGARRHRHLALHAASGPRSGTASVCGDAGGEYDQRRAGTAD